jgi:hypothetical protein
MIGERIRDKFAASRRKGMWMGGTPPLGYDVCERKLVVTIKGRGIRSRPSSLKIGSLAPTARLRRCRHCCGVASLRPAVTR